MFRAFLLLPFFVVPAFADGPLTGAVIVVDPGHGGQSYSKSYTGGTRGAVSKLTESELNLRVAFELEKLLKEAGATVYMTRRADHRLSPEGSPREAELHARIDFFEHFNPHFFLSVHHNAGPEAATGHTALYKHNATDDTLYEALATMVNDALDGKVPGPKRKLIKDNYHILRETSIPGTIAESGFMTNKAYDELCNRPQYPKIEAEAIRDGAVKYWKEHQKALTELRDKLTKERAAKPRDPATITAIALNSNHRAKMKELLAKLEPTGKPDPAKLGQYLEAFRQQLPAERQAKFTMKVVWTEQKLKLSGAAEKEDWNRATDVLIAIAFNPVP